MESQFTAGKAQLIVVVAAVLLYASTLGYGFVFDDSPEVVQNKFIRSPGQLTSVFTTSAWGGSGIDTSIYRPVTTATFALNYWVAGLQPWSYHLVNVMLHAGVSILVLQLAIAVGASVRAALFSAILFAVHPVHVEAVANVAGRKELLVALFTVGAVLAFQVAKSRGGVWIFVTVASTAAAALSKETGFVAIGLIALSDLVVDRDVESAPRSRRLLIYGLCLLATSIVWFARIAVVRDVGISRIPFVDNPAAYAPLAGRLMTSAVVLGKGLLMMVFPSVLSPDYSYNTIRLVDSIWDARLLLSVVGIAVMSSAALRSWQRQRVVLFCLGWYVVSILPASNLLVPIGTIFAERLLYLPSIGACLLFGFLLARAPRRVSIVLAALVVVVLSARTLSYSEYWRSEEKLFAMAVRVVPESVKMQYNFGVHLREQGDRDDAIDAYTEALSTYPNYEEAYVNRGHLRTEQRDYSAAVADFDSAIELNPSDEYAWNGRGLAHRLSGKFSLAISDFNKALELDPDYAVALLNRGLAYEGLGDLSKAATDYEHASRVAPVGWEHGSLLNDRRRKVAQAIEGAPDGLSD